MIIYTHPNPYAKLRYFFLVSLFLKKVLFFISPYNYLFFQPPFQLKVKIYSHPNAKLRYFFSSLSFSKKVLFPPSIYLFFQPPFQLKLKISFAKQIAKPFNPNKHFKIKTTSFSILNSFFQNKSKNL